MNSPAGILLSVIPIEFLIGPLEEGGLTARWREASAGVAGPG